MSGSSSLSTPESGIPASLLRGSPFEGEYTAISFLGRGSFGQVFKLIRPFDGKHYALKVFDKTLENSKKYEGFFRREAEVLRGARCRNIVQFHQYYENSSYMFILLEFCEGGDLNQFLRQAEQKTGGKMGDSDIATVVKGVLNSLYYLHYSENTIHRDLKPGTLPLTSEHPGPQRRLQAAGRRGHLSRRLRPLRGAQLLLQPQSPHEVRH